ncbi:hypothetical protein [Azohydromonas sediminis]|uniref:hypothetical protein n=1 Tax=Azohydromonas sediminis TaxID=2259674 RepID=UPI0013C3421D|nr:hypothetical protein [Azohydromonas sediminis]
MKSSSLLFVAGLALATAGVAVAQERPRSLNDARSDVIHGTGGITLFDFGRKSEPAAAAPAPAAPAAGAPGAAGNAAAPTSGWGTPVAVPAGSTTRAATAPSAAPAPAARKPLFGNLGEIFGPPSGEPLSSAKKHESPSSGIALPTGR